MMITRTAKIYFLLFVLASCSNRNQKEEAEKYFDLIQQTIEPWINSSNRTKNETMPILRRFYDNGRKPNSKDSLELLKYLNDFNKISAKTLNRLDSLETFEEYDLKKPTFECVERSTKAIQEALTEILNTSRSKNQTQEQLDELKNRWINEMSSAKEYYFQTQNEFKRKFGIE